MLTYFLIYQIAIYFLIVRQGFKNHYNIIMKLDLIKFELKVITFTITIKKVKKTVTLKVYIKYFS